jgi:hypothetical protein
MKNSRNLFLLCLTLIAFVTSCQQKPTVGEDTQVPVSQVANENVVDNEAVPVTAEITTIAFDEVDYKFGEIAMGDKAVHRFTFKNTGNAPLIIESVKPSCSCTVGDYTKEPVAPGESGFVETSMEAKNVGVFQKSATVTVNTDPRNHILSFSGEVVQ